MSYADLRDVVQFVPLEKPVPTRGRSSQFDTAFTATAELLAREIRHLRPRRALLEVGLASSDIRLDGLPRANARAWTPGVVLTLVGTAHGDLRYPCGTYSSWQDNVRAIALALEALRKVDRYGVTKRGEQYAGWKQLAGPNDALVQRGRELIRKHGTLRAALSATHPDRDNGDEEAFKAVTAARDAT